MNKLSENKIEIKIEGMQRNLKGGYRKFAVFVSGAMALFHIYFLTFRGIDPWLLRLYHLQFVMIIGFLVYPGWKKAHSKVNFFDFLFIVAGLSTAIYTTYFFDELIIRAGVIPTQMDIIFAFLAVITLIELTRRSTGNILTIIGILFLLYTWFGKYLPGLLWHKGYSIERTLSFMFSIDGIYNIPLGASATYVYLFILFGSFLQITGTGKYFIDSALSFAGQTRGGPAKVAIFASGLFGMINGTSAGNVVATGSFTIPLMKKIGYKPAFAGAVEAVASTGGQIMPPIMGAAAFLMATLLGISYTKVMVSAIIPAFLYYLSLFFMIDFEAVKLKLYGLPKNQLPKKKKIIKEIYYLIPIVILIYFLIIRKSSIIFSGIMGIISSLVLGLFIKIIKNSQSITLNSIGDALFDGARNVVQVSATCAIAGIIIGVLSLTGLGIKFATIIIDLSHNNLLIALTLTMAITIFLGMGLPTIAAYCITASVVAPALIKLDVPPLVAHFFVFYYACLSAITPPVALASYAAAGIAGDNPMRVGVISVRLGLAAFIVPFMFVYGNSLLLIGPISQAILPIITASIGILSLALAAEGYLWKPIFFPLRGILFLASILLIKTDIKTDIIGISLFILVLAIQWLLTHKPTKIK